METQWEISRFIKSWYGIDIDDDIEFHYAESMSSYSWAAVLIVFMKDGIIYIQDNTEIWKPYQVTEKEALDAMLEFDEELNCG